MPHVAAYFRGLTITANLHLLEPATADDQARYRGHYAGEPLVRVVDDAPWVSRIARTATASKSVASPCPATAGAWSSSRRSTTCSRALRRRRLQNLNLAFGYDEFAGIADASVAESVSIR